MTQIAFGDSLKNAWAVSADFHSHVVKRELKNNDTQTCHGQLLRVFLGHSIFNLLADDFLETNRDTGPIRRSNISIYTCLLTKCDQFCKNRSAMSTCCSSGTSGWCFTYNEILNENHRQVGKQVEIEWTNRAPHRQKLRIIAFHADVFVPVVPAFNDLPRTRLCRSCSTVTASWPLH